MGRLRLFEMLRRRAAVLPQPRDADADAAIARCAGCRAGDLCEAWLAEAEGKAPRTFCPNSGYVEYLRQTALRFIR